MLLVAVLVGFLATSGHQMAAQAQEGWWRDMQLYQIYPRSFKDSDGDGIGDLQGITNLMSHLVDSGIKATWLSPIFPSPMKDFGYDISDFYDIAPEYGTMADLENLLKEAKRMGLRVLLDFVPNHSSDQCEWFQKSVNREPGYENYYVWHPGKPGPNNTRLPPSNWISVFRGSAWEWHPVRQEYYLHQFMAEQPDLNYRDPKLVAQMRDVLTFWLKKGVDGFRVDAIPHLVEVAPDKNGNYPDEPLSGLTDDPDDYNYLEHIHTRERDETYEQVYGWRQLLDDFAASDNKIDRVLLMEAMSDIDLVMKYYGNGTHEGAHFPFNFIFAFANKNDNATTLANSINHWFDKLPEGRVSNWVLGNHDQPRLATRFGPERSDGVMMLGMLLPGCSITYQGEEIRQENFYLSWEDTQDPQACNSGPDLFNITSRDPERTPFHWDETRNAGFSTAKKTWLPVADNYKTFNLALQQQAERSPYKMYRALVDLRNMNVVKNGDYQIKEVDSALVLLRSDSKEGKLVVVFNCNDMDLSVNLRKAFPQLSTSLTVLVPSVESPRSKMDVVSSKSLSLSPNEALVLLDSKINSSGF